jgi:hypothetical protein
VWATSDTFSVRGGGHVRIRSNTPEVGALVRALLAERVVEDDASLPYAYSVRLEPVASSRGVAQQLHVLYEDCTVVRSSRDPKRVLSNLVAHVSGRDAVDDGAPPVSMRLAGCAVVGVRGVAVVPLALEPELGRIERRLNDAGLRLVDAPFLTFDPVTAELLVPALPAIDASALDGLDVYVGREPGAAPPGRHRVTGWMLDDLRGAADRRTPAMKLVLNVEELTPDRALRLVSKIQDGATLVARWHPWPADLLTPLIRLAEGRR